MIYGLLNRLKEVVIGGDYAGRDIVNNNILPSPTQFDRLSISYKDEVKNKNHTDEFIDELQHYNTRNIKKRRDLATKLSDAGYSEFIDEAEELKELVSKLIIKHQNITSAQKIITLLLSEIESIFKSEIKPKLINNIEVEKVNEIIRECIEKELRDKLGENVLEIYHRQIKGMVFFLTGNCHLEWD